MPVLTVQVDDETMARLRYFSSQDGRSVEELAAWSIKVEAEHATRFRPREQFAGIIAASGATVETEVADA